MISKGCYYCIKADFVKCSQKDVSNLLRQSIYNINGKNDLIKNGTKKKKRGPKVRLTVMAVLNDCNNCNGQASDNGTWREEVRITVDSIYCGDKAEDKVEDTGSLDRNGSVEKIDKCETAIEESKVPDRGWGWFIILGCLIVRIIAGGISKSHGLFYKRLFERFHQSATATAWVTSITSTIRLSTGPAVSILCNRFPERRLVLVGACVLSVSLFITGFAPNLPFLYFSYGVLGGVGRSLVLTPCTLLLGNYFKKRRSFVFAIASAGFSIGGFALTPLVELMFQTYGFTGTFILLSGLATHAIVSACLFRPVESYNRLLNKRGKDDIISTPKSEITRAVTQTTMNIYTVDETNATLKMYQQGYHVKDAHDKHNINTTMHLNNNRPGELNGIKKTDTEPGSNNTERLKTERKPSGDIKNCEKEKKKKLMSLSIVKDVRFLTFLLSLFFNSMPSQNLFLPSLAVSRGLTEFEAALLLSINAGSDTAFRFIAGLVLDMKLFRDKRPVIYNAMLFLQALAVLSMPLLWSFVSLTLIVSVEGATQGVKSAQKSVVLLDLLGLDKLASSLALSMVVRAAGKLLGPTISGLLKDIYGSYDGAFYFGGSAMLAGALIMAGGNIRKMYLDRQATIDKKTCTDDNIL